MTLFSYPDGSFFEVNYVEALTLAVIVGGAVVWAFREWPSWRRRHTLTFDAPAGVEVGRRLGLPFTVRIRRDTLIQGIGLHCRFARDRGSHVGDGIVNTWLDKKLPYGPTKRGDVFQLELNIDAKEPWEGYLCLEIPDGSGGVCSASRRFKVLASVPDGSAGAE